MFRRGVDYDDVTRCKECAENITLLVATAQAHGRTRSFDLRYECGECGTELGIRWTDVEGHTGDELIA